MTGNTKLAFYMQPHLPSTERILPCDSAVTASCHVLQVSLRMPLSRRDSFFAIAATISGSRVSHWPWHPSAKDASLTLVSAARYILGNRKVRLQT